MIESLCRTLVRSDVRCETHQVECRNEKSPTVQHPNRIAFFCPISGQVTGYAERLSHAGAVRTGQ